MLFGHDLGGFAGRNRLVRWAEKFAAEMQRLTEGRAAFNDMLDWALELWPVHRERDPAEVARGEFRNFQDE